MHEGRDQLVEKVVGVMECGENPCSLLPCNNSGTCFAIDSDNYVCNCKDEYTGTQKYANERALLYIYIYIDN